MGRYQSRLLAFCRHMLSSKEDAEDVLQEVFAAAFNAILADEREINVRPWLYRIARNRSLNHLRRTQAVGVDSMDVHLSENGLTTADKVHTREEFRLLMGDVQELPETQRTALLLREIDALSYDQIAEAMETTVPSVKSLLVRARVSLAEAAEARLLTCEEVRVELGEVAEGLKRTSAPVRRHLRTCERCATVPQAAAPDQQGAGLDPARRAAAAAQEDAAGPPRHHRGRLGRQRRRRRGGHRRRRRRQRERPRRRRGRPRHEDRRRSRGRRDRHRRRRRGQARAPLADRSQADGRRRSGRGRARDRAPRRRSRSPPRPSRSPPRPRPRRRRSPTTPAQGRQAGRRRRRRRRRRRPPPPAAEEPSAPNRDQRDGDTTTLPNTMTGSTETEGATDRPRPAGPAAARGVHPRRRRRRRPPRAPTPSPSPEPSPTPSPSLDPDAEPHALAEPSPEPSPTVTPGS